MPKLRVAMMAKGLDRSCFFHCYRETQEDGRVKLRVDIPFLKKAADSISAKARAADLRRCVPEATDSENLRQKVLGAESLSLGTQES